MKNCKCNCGTIVNKEWARGHNRKGVTLSSVHRERISIGSKDAYKDGIREPVQMIGEKNPKWKYRIPQKVGTGRYMIGQKINARAIVEKILARSLISREIIHHINENKADDRPENLYLFRHRSAHMKWHRYLERNKYEGTILTSNLSLIAQV